jgi:hypothetical protein
LGDDTDLLAVRLPSFLKNRVVELVQLWEEEEVKLPLAERSQPDEENEEAAEDAA